MPSKTIKKYLKEVKLYSKKNKDKQELFNFFIYVLKKNSSWYGDDISIFDFVVEHIINFFNVILDVANDKINEDTTMNDGITMKDEDFKKIINDFDRDLNKLLEEKKMKLNELLGEDNINIMMKEGKEIEVMNIYSFIDILREKGMKLEDNLIISCIFARYQMDENLEDIDLNLLEKDLKRVMVFNN